METTEHDPVCGMTVDPAHAAAQQQVGGKNYYFCCASCASEFRAAPEKYLNAERPPRSLHPGSLVQLGSAGTSVTTTSLAPASASSSRVESFSGAGSRPSRISSKPSLANSYICRMCTEVLQDHPGACPKCGMALEPSLPGISSTRVEYTCPMHPQIVRSEPGSCPDLRNGLGAAHSDSGRGGKSRAAFDDAAILGERRADYPGAGAWECLT